MKSNKNAKSKHVTVRGSIAGIGTPLLTPCDLECIITNDELGKTLSINNGIIQFSIPIEPIEQYLK